MIVAASEVPSPAVAVRVPVLAPVVCGVKSMTATQNGTVFDTVTLVDGAARLHFGTAVVEVSYQVVVAAVSWVKSPGVPKAPVTARLPT